MIRFLRNFLLILNSMLILYMALEGGNAQTVRLNNIKCKAYDPAFAIFRECRLTVVGRGQIALNLYVKLFQLPVSNVTINLELLKRANGYRPFLYNYTVDFCQFMKNKKKMPMVKIFIDVLLNDTNINHTCPYNNDIIVRNLLLKDTYFKLLPLPTGEYLFRLSVGAYNDWKAEVRAYLQRTE